MGRTALLASVLTVATNAIAVPTMTTWVAPAVGIAGLAAWLVAWRRAATLRASARAPHDPSFARVPLSELDITPDALLPLDDQVSEEAAHALVRLRSPNGDGAYRTAAHREPIALVD